MKEQVKDFTIKPLEVYIQEVYELAKTLEIEPINFEELYSNLK